LENEDVARASHRMRIKGGYGGLYAPEDGFTYPVPRFKTDIAALMRLSDFELPPLWVVRPMHVVHSVTPRESNLEQRYRKTTTVGAVFWRQAQAVAMFDFELGCGHLRRRRRA
jgi:hypothetical protein